MAMLTPVHARRFASCALAALAIGAGCADIERTAAPKRASRSDLLANLDIPQVMRGTIASETILDGYNAVHVFGNGMVVGLDGTGASDIPPSVRAYMLATAAKHGIGQESLGWGALSPEQLIDSPDTAVVVVEAIIPPGAVKGSRFDVNIFAYPTSSTSSLEGGRLYTADLLPRTLPDGTIERLPPTGSRQPAALAEATGPLLLNPFAEPGSTASDTVNRRSARILNGGTALKDMPLKLRLFVPSHARAMVIQDAINTRFPREPGQTDDTAHGESDEAIAIHVPPTFHDRTRDFIELLRHTTIRQTAPEAVATTISRHLVANPADAEHASWRWRALGPRAIPSVRELYNYPDEQPRMAALRAGAWLNDAISAEPLIDMAHHGSPGARREAIELLSAMGLNPVIDEALRQIVSDPDAQIRLAAYEALVKRADPSVHRFAVDDKFVVDVIDSTRPMVYITLQGLPRLALFNGAIAIDRPVIVSAWSRRFMIRGDAAEPTVEVYFRAPEALEGIIHDVNPTLIDFIRFLGHTPVVEQPRPGLGMSYGEVVGILHQIWRQGYLAADFEAEQDPIMAAMLRERPRLAPAERPEFGQDGPDDVTGDPPRVDH